MKHFAAALGAFALAAVSSAAFAADYEKAVADSVGSFATGGEFSGVTLNVACRRLPAMDFIFAHKDLFEKATGATIKLTNYPENDLRSKIVADASNHVGGFQVYCLDNNYIPLFASNKWVQRLEFRDQARLQARRHLRQPEDVLFLAGRALRIADLFRGDDPLLSQGPA